MNAGPLSGKVVIITGGSRGIGRSMVREAVSQGARVAFCARSLGAASDESLADAHALGGPGCAIAVAGDVSNEQDVDRLFDATIETFGTVDAVVNNAGTHKDDILVRLSLATWSEVITANLTGSFLVARRAVRHYLERGKKGSVVSIGSVSANGSPSQSSYAQSKGGLFGMTEAIAREYGDRGIRANLVVAGFVETELSSSLPPAGRRFFYENSSLMRAGEPQEISTAALFLASDRAAAMNGRFVYVAGGVVDITLTSL